MGDDQKTPSAGPGWRLGILGGLTAHHGDRPLEVGPLKRRVVLAMLLCRPNEMVSVTALVDALWDDDPPRTAEKNIQVHVSALRKVLGSKRGDGLVRVARGYRLDIGPERLDLLRFHELAQTGRDAVLRGDRAEAALVLGEAVRLWRGPVLPELAMVPALAAEAKRLDERRLDVYEDWAEAMVAVGRHTELLDSLMGMAGQHPFRERLRHAQLLALYRAGRQNEALAQFDSLRQAMARELGLMPSPVITRLYERILDADRALDAPAGVSIRATNRPGLDRDIVDFTGREGPISILTEVLGSGRVIVVNGVVGVGKTTLTVHAAHRFAELFPGGRVLIPLRKPDGTATPAAEVLDAVPVGEGRSLVILDDAVSEAQVRPLLAAVPEHCDILVTSRRHLAGLDGAFHLELEPMTEDEARSLLVRLVGTDRMAAEPQTAGRLAAACCGLPMALRIVGARLAGLRHLPLARFAERLRDGHRVLDEMVAGDLSLRDRLAEAFGDLAPEEQESVHALARGLGPEFSAFDAAPALALPPAGAEAALERLVQARIVRVVEGFDADDVEVVAHGPGSAISEPHYALPWLIQSYVRELSRD